MATDHLQIPDIQANQNQKEVTANAAHNLLDRSLNANDTVTVTVGVNNLTTTQARENFVLELIGTPGAPFTVEMPDTNKRTMAIVNNADDVATVQNPSAGGTGQPVIAVGEAAIFHFDGTNFFDLSALALAVATWLGLTDTPGSYANQNGKHVAVNSAETGLEFVGASVKVPVRVATAAAGTLATDFENGDTVDGVVLSTGDRILIKDQGAGAENGIYVVNATGAPTRADDFNDNTDPIFGGTVAVVAGTANANTIWQLTTGGPYTIGSTVLTFVQVDFLELFTSLTDTPSSYTNHGGKGVRVDSAEAALEFVPQSWKDPVRVATVVDGTLASAFENGDTVDGITLATGDRILLKNQSTASENGIYIVNATGAPTRAIDFDDDADAVLGAVIPIIEGDTQAKTSWMHTTTGAITIGSTSLTFVKMEPVIGFMPLSLGSLRAIAANEIAGPLDDTTTPAFERINGATDKGLRVFWASSNSDEVAFPEVYMPPDIDADKDLTIHLVAEMSGATDTPTIDVQVFDSSGDTEMGGATAAITDTRAEVSVTIAAADITGHPLGWLSISLIPGAHTTDTLAVFSAWIEYTRKTA